VTAADEERTPTSRPSDWTPADLGPAARPKRSVCPACKRWQRVGYRDARPVVGQHDQPAEQVPGTPGAPTWPGSPHCPGSLTPLGEGDLVDHRTARALGRHVDVVTAALPVVPAPRRPGPTGQQPTPATRRPR